MILNETLLMNTFRCR